MLKRNGTRRNAMRVYVKVTIPAEGGNAAIRNGTLVPTVEAIIKELQPELAFFYADAQGRRTNNFLLDLKDPSWIPAIAEPFFLAFNASVEIYPVMLADDLMQSAPHVDHAVKQY